MPGHAYPTLPCPGWLRPKMAVVPNVAPLMLRWEYRIILMTLLAMPGRMSLPFERPSMDIAPLPLSTLGYPQVPEGRIEYQFLPYLWHSNHRLPMAIHA
jgi:hypothetical protein